MASRLHAAGYRAWQFFTALGARLGDDDRRLVRSVLGPVGPRAEALFYRMRRNDQRHAVAVLRAVMGQGFRQPAVGQAALLHDVGKAMGQPLLYRVAIVLLTAYAPDLLARLALTHDPPALSELDSVARWRRPFVIHALHPRLGAQWAAGAGCDPAAVALILHHQDRLEDGRVPPEVRPEWLLALQQADAQN